jgi:glycosyltransferase involved in cell wall biosynthesis
LIHEKKLDAEIKIIGPQFGEAKLAAYHRASLFVLPTYSENFGIVVAEALACGIPVISTHGTPWQDLETHGCGWWIPTGVEALIETLTQALQLPEEQLIAMGTKGQQLVQNKYSMESVASQMLELYNWILNKGNKPEFVYLD